jgi:hypothetical protein
MERNLPEPVNSPVLLAPANVYFLVPELCQKKSAARVYKATRVGSRLVLAAHGAIEWARGRTAERIVWCYAVENRCLAMVCCFEY